MADCSRASDFGHGFDRARFGSVIGGWFGLVLLVRGQVCECAAGIFATASWARVGTQARQSNWGFRDR